MIEEAHEQDQGDFDPHPVAEHEDDTHRRQLADVLPKGAENIAQRHLKPKLQASADIIQADHQHRREHDKAKAKR